MLLFFYFGQIDTNERTKKEKGKPWLDIGVEKKFETPIITFGWLRLPIELGLLFTWFNFIELWLSAEHWIEFISRQLTFWGHHLAYYETENELIIYSIQSVTDSSVIFQFWSKQWHRLNPFHTFILTKFIRCIEYE